MKRKWIKKAPAVIAFAALGVFLFSGVVMLLWNNILPSVLHVGVITFWQAMGIIALSKILFGGFRRPAMAGGWWRKRMRMKWESMTPEEKEKFRSRMHHCHPYRTEVA